MTAHEHTPFCVGIEVRGVYDGVLYWHCGDGVIRHRWPAGTRLGDAARRYAGEVDQ